VSSRTIPKWLEIAYTYEGLREIPGAQTAPFIRRWLDELGAWWHDDETPWCGVAMGAWMKQAGESLPKDWYRARGWLNWGVPLSAAEFGCVVVFNGGPKRPGAGHVGIVAGQDAQGRLVVFGGNQGNKVGFAPFDRDRVLGYRYPAGKLAPIAPLPLFASATGAVSTNEA